MALSENEVSSENAKSTPTETSKPTGNEKKEKPLTKIIIRRLPPSMTKEAFIEQVSPVPDYDYLYLVKGDMSLGENAFSRVYINFVNAKDVFNFKEKFDNYVFVDGKGHEYPAVVEFAAFQKIPKRRSKFRVDPKCNTIETDPMYLEFLESLKDQPAEEEKPEFSYQPSSDVKKDMTTPLLEYIKQKKMDKQRIREEKREERKRREIERKQRREEDRRKRRSETSPAVTGKGIKESVPKSIQTAEVKEKDEAPASVAKPEKTEKGEFKSTEKGYNKKYEDRKTSSKVKTKANVRGEKTFDKKGEYNKKKDEARAHKQSEREARKESAAAAAASSAAAPDNHKPAAKKVKKYSERREERKIEAQRAEQKKTEQKKSAESGAQAAEGAPAEKQPPEPNSAEEKPKENDPELKPSKQRDVEEENMERERKIEDEGCEDDEAAGRIYNSEPSLFQEKLLGRSGDDRNSLARTERRKSMDESKSDGLMIKENENAMKMMQRQSSLGEDMSEDCCSSSGGGGGGGGGGSKREGGGGGSGGERSKRRNKENDPRTQRRIRNKDRPTMQLYQPGMLSKRRQSDNSEDSKN